jgi:hypothetical protein
MYSVILVGIKGLATYLRHCDFHKGLGIVLTFPNCFQIKCDGRQPRCIPCANYGTLCTYLEKPKLKPKTVKPK